MKKCEQSLFSTILSQSNSDLVREFFDGIDIYVGVTSQLTNEEDADATLVDSLANVETLLRRSTPPTIN